MGQQTASASICYSRNRPPTSASHGRLEDTYAASSGRVQNGTRQDFASGKRDVRDEKLQQSYSVRRPSEAGPLHVDC